MRAPCRLAAMLVLLLAWGVVAAEPGIVGRVERRPLVHAEPLFDVVGWV